MDLGGSLAHAGRTVVAFLPHALGALMLLLAGCIVARLVRTALTRLLVRAGLDRSLAAGPEGGTRRALARVVGDGSPSRLLARAASWLVLGAFVVAAVGVLDLASVTAALDRALAYLPHVLVALGLLVVAVLVSAAAPAAVERTLGGTVSGRLLAVGVPGVVWVATTVLVLDQLRVAPELVHIAFASVSFGTALALALAFGLGGREAAARLVGDAERTGRTHADQVRSDFALARRRARQAARTARRPEPWHTTPAGAPQPVGAVAQVAHPEPTQNLEPLVSSDPGRAYARPDLYATDDHRTAWPPR